MCFLSPAVGVGQTLRSPMAYVDKKRFNLCTKCSSKKNTSVRRERL